VARIAAEPLRTPRLDLVPMETGHAEEMAVVLGDPALYGFIGGTPATPSALRDRYARMTAGAPQPEVSWCNWVLALRGEGCLAGTVQATVAPDGDGPSAEIAWVVGVPWQGRGLATEAARALAGWLRARGVRTLVAHVHPDHHASAAVAAAAGLAPTGEWHDGEVRWRSAAGG